jgi:signal transduction histidine kinase
VESTQATVEASTPTGSAVRETRRRQDSDPANGTSGPTGSGAGEVGRRPGRLRPDEPRPAPLANVQAIRPARTAPARTAPAGPDEWRRLERDLHDGVQNELVTLIVALASAEQDPRTPPAVAEMLAALEARAQAALASVRNIAGGIYPRVLADFGVPRALRTQAARAAIEVRLRGAAPRSTREVEEAVYFSCSEAIQNAAKHAGPAAHVEVSLHHHPGRLVVSIADDGPGFDPSQTLAGSGLQNIRTRIQDVGGTFSIASNPGPGTVLIISLPWPPPAGATP